MPRCNCQDQSSHCHHNPEPQNHSSQKQHKTFWLLWLPPLAGLVSLVWFLVRVVPKPSRASYPCQRAAMPLAAGFVTWLVGVVTSVVAFHRAKNLARRSRYIVAALSMAVCIAAMCMALNNTPLEKAEAITYEDRYAEKPANQPMGVAKGVNPGRVVWVHDPDATNWADPTPEDYYDDYWWDDGNTDQAVVDNMVAISIRQLAGVSTSEAAWEVLFKHFNSSRGLGNIGYQADDRIAIKINLTVANVSSYNAVDDDGNQQSNLVWNSVSVEMIASLLDQLVNVAGVPQQDIYIGDPTCYFPNREYDYLVARFPYVNYMSAVDGKQLPGRPKTVYSDHELYFSDPGAAGTTQDYLPAYYADAKYFINFAILKAHLGAVTLCGKNHYGSLNRRPSDGGYYNLHNSLPYINGGTSQYRALVDLMGHKDTGGKTLLYILDGLWGGYSWGGVCPPQKWRMAPFNGDHPNSIFVSQDPVAIDSVGFDFWWAEDRESWDYFPFTHEVSGRQHMPHISGGDDYLIEAALADNPPSGTVYDPENDGITLTSLGVHEHWNNAADKQYTRNLGTDTGIELVAAAANSPVTGKFMFYNNSILDGYDAAANGNDDFAIATNKAALLANSTASSVNCSNFAYGINGVMIDIKDLPATPTAADFDFAIGNGTSWTAPTTPTIAVRPGEGVDGTDRITLIWPDGEIVNCWLRVTTLATAQTGLDSDDVSYFANLRGDSNSDFSVNLDDFIILKQNYGLSSATFEQGDYDGNGIVNLDDFITLKQNYGQWLTIIGPGQ